MDKEQIDEFEQQRRLTVEELCNDLREEEKLQTQEPDFFMSRLEEVTKFRLENLCITLEGNKKVTKKRYRRGCIA